jgi:XTP/dITP diphosphohydrolase
MNRTKILYATQNAFKQAEIYESLKLIPVGEHGSGKLASDVFDVEFPKISTDEPLERDLRIMVRHKAISAYRSILAPCVVEHAGIVLPNVDDANYPGGLTQPMFDALKPTEFVKGLTWAGEDAIARAVVGYCDGFNIHTFIGETKGKLIPEPKGSRDFYWDTVFVPNGGDGRSYSEIAGNNLSEKMKLSQSQKAFERCLNFILKHQPELFRD